MHNIYNFWILMLILQIIMIWIYIAIPIALFIALIETACFIWFFFCLQHIWPFQTKLLIFHRSDNRQWWLAISINWKLMRVWEISQTICSIFILLSPMSKEFSGMLYIDWFQVGSCSHQISCLNSIYNLCLGCNFLFSCSHTRWTYACGAFCR